MGKQKVVLLQFRLSKDVFLSGDAVILENPLHVEENWIIDARWSIY